MLNGNDCEQVSCLGNTCKLQNKINQLEDKYNNLQKQVNDLKEIIWLSKNSAFFRSEHASFTSGNKKGRDHTQYKFNGKSLNKQQLVLECVIQYIKDYNVNNAKTFLDAFGKTIPDTHGVIREKEDVKKTYKDYEKRFFTEKPIFFSENEDQEWWVSKYWKKETIDIFIERMEKFEYTIEKLED